MTRHLNIDLGELEFAFSDSSLSSYLDLESGQVITVTEEIREAYDDIEETADAAGLEFAEALAESDLPDWLKDAAAEVGDLEARCGKSVIEVPTDDSSEAYRDMADFAVTVRDPRLTSQLNRALDGSRPFRRFKDVLLNYPKEEQLWFEFRDERIRARVMEWLEGEGIDPGPQPRLPDPRDD